MLGKTGVFVLCCDLGLVLSTDVDVLRVKIVINVYVTKMDG